MAFIIVYITHPNKEHATSISGVLIKEKLVACSNIFPINSSYWWQGQVVNEDEFVSIVKTRADLYPELVSKVEKLHSYEVPCIMKIEAEANPAYEKWIIEETKSAK